MRLCPCRSHSAKGDPIEFAEDEGIRANTTAESLSGLRPAFPQDGTITAGSASQISDGACAVVVMNKAKAAGHGPDLVVRSARTATSPARFDSAVAAGERDGRRYCARAFRFRRCPGDQRTFAAVALMSTQELGIDPVQVNPLAAIAMGHRSGCRERGSPACGPGVVAGEFRLCGGGTVRCRWPGRRADSAGLLAGPSGFAGRPGLVHRADVKTKFRPADVRHPRISGDAVSKSAVRDVTNLSTGQSRRKGAGDDRRGGSPASKEHSRTPVRPAAPPASRSLRPTEAEVLVLLESGAGGGPVGSPRSQARSAGEALAGLCRGCRQVVAGHHQLDAVPRGGGDVQCRGVCHSGGAGCRAADRELRSSASRAVTPMG